MIIDDMDRGNFSGSYRSKKIDICKDLNPVNTGFGSFFSLIDFWHKKIHTIKVAIFTQSMEGGFTK